MSQKTDKAKIYNSREWKALRAAKIQANPLCERCLEAGYVTPARTVHHKIPIETARNYEEMKRLAFCGMAGLQSLCFQCHSDIHKQMNSRSAEGHKASSIASLERFKSQHQPPTESALPTPGGMNLLQPISDSQIHLPPIELGEQLSGGVLFPVFDNTAPK